MPELPEVETIRRQLDKVLAGQKIKKIVKLHQKSLQGDSLKVAGKKIVAVKRKAKMIWVDLQGDCSLLVHLKMTGQLIYNGKPGKHTRIVFELSRGRLIFNDLRKLGWIKILPKSKIYDLISNLPPDVVDKEFTPNYLRIILARSGRAVKLVLLDQQKMGGVGNIYANEALFLAGIRPTMPSNKLTALQVRNMKLCIQRVINQGIKHGGTTASDESFVNLFGRPGRYQKQLRVYENKGKCNRCGTKIQKIKLGGRGTYYCPTCQK